MNKKDFFLSHATPDKEPFVRPFALELEEAGLSYWLDEAEIAWGDKIAARIQQGLETSKFIIVFITPAFIGRNWPEAELSAALTRESNEGRTVVLPIVAGDPRVLLSTYPLLRDKQYREWKTGAPRLVAELKNLVVHPNAPSSNEIPPASEKGLKEDKYSKSPYKCICYDDIDNVYFFPYTYDRYISLLRGGGYVGLGASEHEAETDVRNKRMYWSPQRREDGD